MGEGGRERVCDGWLSLRIIKTTLEVTKSGPEDDVQRRREREREAGNGRGREVGRRKEFIDRCHSPC